MTPEQKQNLHHFLKSMLIRNPEADKPLKGAFDKDGKQLTFREAVEQNRVPDRVYEGTQKFFDEMVKAAEYSTAKLEKFYTTEELKKELQNRKQRNRGPKP